MITHAKYGHAAFEPILATTALVGSGADLNNNRFVDPTKPASQSVLLWNRRNTAGNQGQVASGIYRKFVANSGLATEESFEVSANLALKFDRRYATVEQKRQVIEDLIAFLLSEESEGAGLNLLRIAQGEL